MFEFIVVLFESVFVNIFYIIFTFHITLGEKLEKIFQNSIILEANEGLLLRTQKEFDDILPDGKYTQSLPNNKYTLFT